MLGYVRVSTTEQATNGAGLDAQRATIAAEAERRGVEVILVVGYKQPRWPEWYPPRWAANLPTDRTRERVLKLVDAEVAYARRSGSIALWQVENEPFRRFGEGGDFDVLRPEFLAEEIALVKRLDHRPTLMTDSGELSTWIPAMRLPALLAALAVAFLPLIAFAEEKPAETAFTIGEGKLALKAPAGWKKVQPKSRIIEAEFEIPAVDGDEMAGRLTAMGAGGSVEANIDRWVAQFTGDDVKPKVEKKTVGGSEVHVVDLTGTYKDTPGGPFAGGFWNSYPIRNDDEARQGVRALDHDT